MQRCRLRHSLAFDRGVALHLSFGMPISDDVKTRSFDTGRSSMGQNIHLKVLEGSPRPDNRV